MDIKGEAALVTMVAHSRTPYIASDQRSCFLHSFGTLLRWSTKEQLEKLKTAFPEVWDTNLKLGMAVPKQPLPTAEEIKAVIEEQGEPQT
jgi:hypothetical protein